MSKKPVGYRMCAACRNSFPKQALTRFYLEDGCVKVGTGTGRGVYLCNNADCRAKAKKKKVLQRAFKQALTEEVYDRMLPTEP